MDRGKVRYGIIVAFDGNDDPFVEVKKDKAGTSRGQYVVHSEVEHFRIKKTDILERT